MKLRRFERRWYAMPITVTTAANTPVTVPPGDWEASFDRGLTWHPAQPHPDLPTAPAWLVAHVTFPGPGDPSTPIPGQILIAVTTIPLLRLIDQPEVMVPNGETIIAM